MKKNLLIVSAFVAVLFACQTRKATSTAVSEKEVVTAAQLTAVQAQFPDATQQELEKGHAVFTGPCTKCHGMKDVTAYSEPKLLAIVDDMAKKSHLSPEEKQALIRFAVGVRATSAAK